jgi:uncharacterized membrane protein YkvA (DUF1232 family)
MSNELIDVFNDWINTLPQDARAMRAALEAEKTPREAKRHLVGGLSYILRKIDIVPDYLTGVGLVDDAAVLRIACQLAQQSGLGELSAELANPVEALAGATAPLESYLGDLHPKLVEFVKALPDETVRGRTADKVLDDQEAYKQFMRELDDELNAYSPQAIADPDRAAREIKSFFKAKLDK